MAINNGSAEIVRMEDARARRRGEGEFAHAGAFLASAREAIGLSITEAAAKTHIKERHLEAIETLEIASLPPRPYAVGFVRTYAEFLELDAGQVVSRFKEDAGYEVAQPIEVEKFEAAETAAENENHDMSLAAVIVIILFMVWCAWQITRPHEVTMLGEEPGESAPVTTAAPPAPEPREVIEARILERVEPIYPLRCAASAQSIESVTVVFNITTAGRVAGERVAQASDGCFGDAALNALRRWRFEPRKVDGEAHPAYDQEISFTFNRPQ